MKRRAFLTGTGAVLLLPNLQACSWFLSNPNCVFNQHTPTNSGLVIDAHAHFFNGSDLQVAAFVKQVAGRELIDWAWLRNEAGDLLQLIGWNAPTAQDELQLITNAKTCFSHWQDKKLKDKQDEQFDLARTEFLRADEKQRAQGGINIFAAKIQNLNRALPKTYDELYAIPEETFTAYSALNIDFRKIIAVFRFVVEMFQYRYVSAHHYLKTYNTTERKIDLAVSHLVDYDWFIAKGKSTPSSIPEQIQLMGEIAKVSNGIVNYFAPYCPLRHVAWNAGKTAKNFDPLALVKEAVEKHGALGVKLYPPMGFALWGNEELQKADPKLWRDREFLPDICKTNEFGKKLDECLALFYDYCQKNNVPIMAHTAISNLSDDAFNVIFNSDSLTDLVTKRFPKLKISFGHFGGFGWSNDTSEAENKSQRNPTIWRELIRVMQAASNNNIYVDTGFFSAALENETDFKKSLQALLAANPLLINKMLYGTDWKMLITEQDAKQYLKAFEHVLNEPEIRPLVSIAQQNNIFGSNAVEYLGLHRGENNNRSRAEKFYGVSSQPHWFLKV